MRLQVVIMTHGEFPIFKKNSLCSQPLPALNLQSGTL